MINHARYKRYISIITALILFLQSYVPLYAQLLPSQTETLPFQSSAFLNNASQFNDKFDAWLGSRSDDINYVASAEEIIKLADADAFSSQIREIADKYAAKYLEIIKNGPKSAGWDILYKVTVPYLLNAYLITDIDIHTDLMSEYYKWYKSGISGGDIELAGIALQVLAGSSYDKVIKGEDVAGVLKNAKYSEGERLVYLQYAGSYMASRWGRYYFIEVMDYLRLRTWDSREHITKAEFDLFAFYRSFDGIWRWGKTICSNKDGVWAGIKNCGSSVNKEYVEVKAPKRVSDMFDLELLNKSWPSKDLKNLNTGELLGGIYRVYAGLFDGEYDWEESYKDLYNRGSYKKVSEAHRIAALGELASVSGDSEIKVYTKGLINNQYFDIKKAEEQQDNEAIVLDDLGSIYAKLSGKSGSKVIKLYNAGGFPYEIKISGNMDDIEGFWSSMVNFSERPSQSLLNIWIAGALVKGAVKGIPAAVKAISSINVNNAIKNIPAIISRSKHQYAALQYLAKRNNMNIIRYTRANLAYRSAGKAASQGGMELVEGVKTGEYFRSGHYVKGVHGSDIGRISGDVKQAASLGLRGTNAGGRVPSYITEERYMSGMSGYAADYGKAQSGSKEIVQRSFFDKVEKVKGSAVESLEKAPYEISRSAMYKGGSESGYLSLAQNKEAVGLYERYNEAYQAIRGMGYDFINSLTGRSFGDILNFHPMGWLKQEGLIIGKLPGEMPQGHKVFDIIAGRSNLLNFKNTFALPAPALALTPHALRYTVPDMYPKNILTLTEKQADIERLAGLSLTKHIHKGVVKLRGVTKELKTDYVSGFFTYHRGLPLIVTTSHFMPELRTFEVLNYKNELLGEADVFARVANAKPGLDISLMIPRSINFEELEPLRLATIKDPAFSIYKYDTRSPKNYRAYGFPGGRFSAKDTRILHGYYPFGAEVEPLVMTPRVTDHGASGGPLIDKTTKKVIGIAYGSNRESSGFVPAPTISQFITNTLRKKFLDVNFNQDLFLSKFPRLADNYQNIIGRYSANKGTVLFSAAQRNDFSAPKVRSTPMSYFSGNLNIQPASFTKEALNVPNEVERGGALNWILGGLKSLFAPRLNFEYVTKVPNPIFKPTIIRVADIAHKESVFKFNAGGSGFAIEHNGSMYGVTAAHNLSLHAPYANIISHDGKSFSAEIIKRDLENDLAFLKLSPRAFEYFKPLKLYEGQLEKNDQLSSVGFLNHNDRFFATDNRYVLYSNPDRFATTYNFGSKDPAGYCGAPLFIKDPKTGQDMVAGLHCGSKKEGGKSYAKSSSVILQNIKGFSSAIREGSRIPVVSAKPAFAQRIPEPRPAVFKPSVLKPEEAPHKENIFRLAGGGSGFAIEYKGSKYGITAGHNISADMPNVRIVGYDGKSSSAEVIMKDLENDLAFLKFSPDYFQQFKPFKIYDGELKVDDKVYSLGFVQEENTFFATDNRYIVTSEPDRFATTFNFGFMDGRGYCGSPVLIKNTDNGEYMVAGLHYGSNKEKGKSYARGSSLILKDLETFSPEIIQANKMTKTFTQPKTVSGIHLVSNPPQTLPVEPMSDINSKGLGNNIIPEITARGISYMPWDSEKRSAFFIEVRRKLAEYFDTDHYMTPWRTILRDYNVDAYKKSTFMVNVPPYTGSAFFTEYLGMRFLVTNRHVVSNRKTVDLIDYNKNKFAGDVVAITKKREGLDLAFILPREQNIFDDKMPLNMSLKPLKFGGEGLYTLGYIGQNDIFSKTDLLAFEADYTGRYPQINALPNIYGGNSGGPLIKPMFGNGIDYVVGMAQSATSLNSFFIPSSTIKAFIKKIIRLGLSNPDFDNNIFYRAGLFGGRPSLINQFKYDASFYQNDKQALPKFGFTPGERIKNEHLPVVLQAKPAVKNTLDINLIHKYMGQFTFEAPAEIKALNTAESKEIEALIKKVNTTLSGFKSRFQGYGGYQASFSVMPVWSKNIVKKDLSAIKNNLDKLKSKFGDNVYLSALRSDIDLMFSFIHPYSSQAYNFDNPTYHVRRGKSVLTAAEFFTESGSLYQPVSFFEENLSNYLTEGKTVAVINDESEILAFFEQLAAKGKLGKAAVKTYGTGREFFNDVLKGVKPDMIISDMVLDDFDGVSIISTMKRSGVNVPSVVLTGLFSENMEKLYTLGFDGFINNKGLYGAALFTNDAYALQLAEDDIVVKLSMVLDNYNKINKTKK